MDKNKLQDVFDIIQEFLPREWTQIAFFVGYTEGSFSMKFYYKCDSGPYVNCFNIPSLSEIDLYRAFIEIDKILSPVRNQDIENEKWTIMTMTVDSNGKMKADFDYKDHSEDLVACQQNWEQLFLK
jgi:hypothetical protein